MTVRETTDHVLAQRRLAAEITNAGHPFDIPTEAILDQSRRRGDILLYDDLDDSRTDGRGMVAWITAENWATGRNLSMQHLWGPSTFQNGNPRFLEILISVCEWGVGRDLDPRFLGWPLRFADTPMRYALTQQAIAQLATALAGVITLPDMRYAAAPMRAALPLLIAAR